MVGCHHLNWNEVNDFLVPHCVHALRRCMFAFIDLLGWQKSSEWQSIYLKRYHELLSIILAITPGFCCHVIWIKFISTAWLWKRSRAPLAGWKCFTAAAFNVLAAAFIEKLYNQKWYINGS